jgi:hypothetical protein
MELPTGAFGERCAQLIGTLEAIGLELPPLVIDEMLADVVLDLMFVNLPDMRGAAGLTIDKLRRRLAA